MIRVLFLVVCLVCVTMADTDEPAQPRKRRHHRASEFVYPYFEISVGAQHATSDYKIGGSGIRCILLWMLIIPGKNMRCRIWIMKLAAGLRSAIYGNSPSISFWELL